MTIDQIKPGDLYSDCGFTPRLCIEADYGELENLTGISLIDGSIGCCSPYHCGPQKHTLEQALFIRDNRDKIGEDYMNGTYSGEMLRQAGIIGETV